MTTHAPTVTTGDGFHSAVESPQSDPRPYDTAQSRNSSPSSDKNEWCGQVVAIVQIVEKRTRMSLGRQLDEG